MRSQHRPARPFARQALPEHTERRREFGLAALVWAAGFTVYRWDALSTGLRSISLGPGDGRGVLFLLEHWLEVFSCRAPWRDPGQFFPARGTLGWYDAHFLQALLYVPLRLVGLERFLAFQGAQAALSAIGFFGFFCFARSVLGVAPTVALGASLLFTFASSLHASTPQAQLGALLFVPWILLAAARALQRAERSPARAATLAATAGLLHALLLYTSFYIGWFVAIAAVIFTVSVALLEPQRLRGAVRGRRRAVTRIVAAGAVGWIAGIIPFALTYGPVVASGRARTLDDALSSLAKPSDIVNVGARNLVWGRLLRASPGYPLERLLDPNLYRTVTPAVLLTVLVGGLVLARQRRAGSTSPAALWVPALALTVLGCLLLPMRIGGLTVWPAIYSWVPGARAIRFAWRLEIVNAAVAAIAVTLILEAMRRRAAAGEERRPVAVLLAPALCTFLVLEQLSTDDWARLDRLQERERLAAIPAPPSECRAFALVDEVGTIAVPNAFALLVAQEIGLPTMNGLEGPLYPDPPVEVVARATVVARARAVLAAAGDPPGVCLFDLASGTWDPSTLGPPAARTPGGTSPGDPSHP